MAKSATKQKVTAAERVRMKQLAGEQLEEQLRELMRKVPDKVLNESDVATAKRFKDWGASAAKAVGRGKGDVGRLGLLIARYREFEKLGR